MRSASLLGPLLVLVGAWMWGLETYPRDHLLKVFDSDIIVFHEHWLGVILTFPFLVIGWRGLRGVSPKAWMSIVASGVFGSALGTVCFTKSLSLLNQSVANLLLNVQPLVAIAVAWFWIGERPRVGFYPWAVVALLSGVMLALNPDDTTSTTSLQLGLLCVAGTIICWGAATTFGRRAMLEIDFKTATALRYIVGSTVATGLAFADGDFSARVKWRELMLPDSAKYMLGMLLFAAITPTFIYFAGLARTKASVATFAEMGQTVASLMVTWAIMGQALSTSQMAAGAALMVAVVFINRSVDDGRQAAEQPEPVPQIALG